MWIPFFWLLCVIAAAIIGARHDRAGTGLVLGALFGPFGILFALVLRGNRRECPHCRELMHEEATACPHCQRDVPRASGGNRPWFGPTSDVSVGWFFAACVGCLIVFFGGIFMLTMWLR